MRFMRDNVIKHNYDYYKSNLFTTITLIKSIVFGSLIAVHYVSSSSTRDQAYVSMHIDVYIVSTMLRNVGDKE